MRNAGDEVTVTVEYLREAPSFLKLPLGKGEGRSSRVPRSTLFMQTIRHWQECRSFPELIFRERKDAESASALHVPKTSYPLRFVHRLLK